MKRKLLTAFLLLCLLLSLTGVLAAAAWLIGAIVPELLRCALQLAGELPELAGYLAGILQDGSLLHKLQAAGLPDADLLAAARRELKNWGVLFTDGMQKRLVTAEEARLLRRQGRFPAPGAVLTPLAKEILEGSD